MPNPMAQEALIKRAYEVAGIPEISKTAFFECHGTGTSAGDLAETQAIASVFGNNGVYIGSTKPNLGHSEGASGLTSLLKAVLALEHRTIPPNIKSSPPNPKIPFERARLSVPVKPLQWPAERHERISINSFGIGGANAHVIVESATSFTASRAETEPEKITLDTPRLLLYSANTIRSLKDMIRNYQSLLTKSSVDMADLSYTLANRREHLTYRSFAVITKDNLDMTAPVPSQDASHAAPSLVMVFTGQGAAWAQFGRELMLSNSIFSHTIKSLDKHLKSLGTIGPSWSLEEELLKPARSSRVNEAEFSQPLCTALQIALVDTLASIAIKPVAVVGHSSGEIAAAYTASSLTAKEAITVAFLRGAATKVQTHQHQGGMAAVGLSWQDTQKYLVPGVVTACDNSPSSVTLSGDAEQLKDVIATIKQDRPNIPTTTLKVERAYHSHHMLAFGEEYHQAMIDSKVVGQPPSIPFFSSVTGELLGSTKRDQLGPQYWKANLERPVLFRAAVSNVLKSTEIKNEVFLEVGPHSALAGPLRQILSYESSKAPYISTLVRRQNSVENLLQAIGKLYTLHFKIDFRALIPGGSCISDLPCYPWDHQRRYWYESRVSKEWRQRKYPYHDLLGERLLESTDLEPVWRNLLHIGNTPWVCDHKINDGIVFPFSGYVAMAAEAARQVSGIQDGVSLQHVAVNTALLLNEDTPTELVTSMRRGRLTDTLNSEWWEFIISSHNGHVWTKHCSGQVRAESSNALLKYVQGSEDLPRKVHSSKWYEAVRRAGLNYGPYFTTLEQMKSSTGSPHQATAIVQNNRWGDEAQYHLHPVILDSYFQLMSVATRDGVGHAYRRLVASSVESLTISRCAVDQISISATVKFAEDGLVAHGSCVAASNTVLRVSGVRTALFEETHPDDQGDVPITGRCEWVPHIDFKNINDLIKPTHGLQSCMPLLTKLANLSISRSQKVAKCIEVHTPHLIKYKEWLNQLAPSHLEESDIATLTQGIESLTKQLEGTSAAHAATTITAVSTNVEGLLKAEKSGFEVLNIDGNMDMFMRFIRENNDLRYLKCLGHSIPNLKVLEVGAGLGERALGIVKNLTRDDGQILYSQYTLTDMSSGMVSTAKERLKGVPNMEFATLDVSKGMAEQGFENRQFDLIIAAGIIHTTPSVQQSLRNIYRLLSPSGRLLLHEPQPNLLWAKFVLGTLPSWWCYGNDGRADGPFMSPKRWQQELEAAGFADVDHVSSESEPGVNFSIIAKPQRLRMPVKRITLLCESKESQPGFIIQELEARGYEICRCSLGDIPPQDQDVLALLDGERPFCENMDARRFTELKVFISNLSGSSGILWVTRLSNIGCQDPRYAQVIGLARTLRSEMAIDFATCETDDVESQTGANAVADVLHKFHGREEGAILGPDYEYAIYNGETLVNRIFPFSLDQELLISDPSEEAILSITQPGRLDTLHWSSQATVTPKEDEVEVEVYAAGLNFRVSPPPRHSTNITKHFDIRMS
ncbi:putative PKS/NRPS-like protein biosynthetic cluster [Arthroderma sp. PD_2]|nr:putative PKS/NRPS-like protein biosynthetic cluster [Arthroderma sp. PD_2]